MNIFDILTMIGGLCLFLFGMSVMGTALQKRAGGKLRSLLEKMTSGRLTGFLAGCGITAVIQSSSATTVMVVGFVNSGLMTLRQAINVIMGSNVGTTITAWILSLSGISADSTLVQIFKPTSFVPIIALIGIVMYMMKGDEKRKESATILLGFATLMFGMETMSSSAAGLAELPMFKNAFVAFENPFLGVLIGAGVTAIVQSSSAAVGILQALAMTGMVPYSAAIPIIVGTCIGTCVTAMISSIGTRREARQAAMAHLTFNVSGSVLWISAYCIADWIAEPAILSAPATLVGIAVINTAFNLLTAAVFLPAAGILERIVLAVVPNSEEEKEELPLELDERLLVTPSLALERCEEIAKEMAECSTRALQESMRLFDEYSEERAQQIKDDEERTDRIEDVLGSFLIKLSGHEIGPADNERITLLLKVTGDYERIADHSVNIMESAEEMQVKGLRFTEDATEELRLMMRAVDESICLARDAFLESDLHAAEEIEPLEQIIDDLKEKLRTDHIERMKEGRCGAEAGFVWSDLLTDLERCSDHCSNIAGCVIEAAGHTRMIHETLRRQKEESKLFETRCLELLEKYHLQQ